VIGNCKLGLMSLKTGGWSRREIRYSLDTGR
jgi:hypothetical protein